MADLTQVTYCGLYCGLCSQCNRIPGQSRALRDTMRKEGWENWGGNFPGFVDFWKFLSNMADSEGICSCRGGECGPPFCGIRKCARTKGVDVCPFCDEYPCHRIRGIARGYVTMLADGERMKQIGLDAWIGEQEARKATGFCYCDIRCDGYEIAED